MLIKAISDEGTVKYFNPRYVITVEPKFYSTYSKEKGVGCKIDLQHAMVTTVYDARPMEEMAQIINDELQKS